MSGNVDLGDSVKARFGTGNDLEIFHDGSHSYIKDNGTGSLLIQGSTAVVIEDPSGNNMAFFEDGGEAILYHNASARLTTKAAGIDVTGDVLTDTLTLDNSSNDWQFSVSGNNLIISYGGTNKAKLDSSGNLTVVGNVTAYGSI